MADVEVILGDTSRGGEERLEVGGSPRGCEGAG